MRSPLLHFRSLPWRRHPPRSRPILITPDKVETRIGTLEFKDGAPSAETVEKVYDTLDFTRGLDAFLNSYGGASAYAIRQGLLSIGAEDNTVTIYPELMDSKSLFLTANADTVYYFSIVDLTKGPMVVEQPPKGLGTINDMWFGWIIDVGFPGPDRGEGGRYLLLPPGYDGPVPEGGFYVARSKTNARHLCRSRLPHGQRSEADRRELIKKTIKIYPYTPGGVGTSIATALEGKVRLEANPPVPDDQVRGGERKVVQHDSSKRLLVLRDDQRQRSGRAGRFLQSGACRTIGGHRHREGQAIQAGRPDEEDSHRRGRGRKCRRTRAELASQRISSIGLTIPDSCWANMLWQGGANFETPPPMITKEGFFEPLPPTGARTLNSKTAFYYGYTLDSPGMIMRLPKVGSQYLMGFLDADKNDLDGGKTYKVTLPKDIPAAAFWSFTLYDNQIALDAPNAAALSARRQPELSVARRRSGRGRLDDDLFRPDPARGRETRQLDPDHARQGLVHAPSPLQPARALLHEGMAAERDRTGALMHRCPTR